MKPSLHFIYLLVVVQLVITLCFFMPLSLATEWFSSHAFLEHEPILSTQKLPAQVNEAIVRQILLSNQERATSLKTIIQNLALLPLLFSSLMLLGSLLLFWLVRRYKLQQQSPGK